MPEPQRRWGIVRADWAAHSEVGADELAVLCLLSLHADKRDGTCYPSQTTLARSLKRSRPWVIAVLNRLEALGLVRRDPHPALRVRLYTVVGHADALSSCRKLPARDMSHVPDTPAQTSDMQCHPADTEQRASPVESSSQSAPGELTGQKPVSEPEVGIGFGHTDFQELLPLARLAKEIGCRATLDHPLLELNKLLLDEMKQLRDLGVYVGTYCQPMIPSLYQPVADPMETIRTIKEIGPDRCIIGSDFGQVLHMDAIDGMRVFIRALLGFGIKPEEVKVMLKDNPAKLMWLEESR